MFPQFQIPAMHIPDGFLSLPLSVIGLLISAVLMLMAFYQVRAHLNPQRLPLIGILAAFIFSAQMLNFPVASATSGHLVGAALAAVLLGPWAAVLVIASVLAVQCLVFQDGGILALGMNIFNMGILSAFVGYAVYRLGARFGTRGRYMGAAGGAWAAVIVSSAAAAIELALSGTVLLQAALPDMIAAHIFIGIGEALITVAVLAFVEYTRPELMRPIPQTNTSRRWVTAGMLLVLSVVLLSPLASSHPDGLERVAIDHGFHKRAEAAPYDLLPDYTVPLIENPALTTIASGVLGAGLVGLLALGAGGIAARRKETTSI